MAQEECVNGIISSIEDALDFLALAESSIAAVALSRSVHTDVSLDDRDVRGFTLRQFGNLLRGALDGFGSLAEVKHVDSRRADKCCGFLRHNTDDGNLDAVLFDDFVVLDAVRKLLGALLVDVRGQVRELRLVFACQHALAEVFEATVIFVVAHCRGVEPQSVEVVNRGLVFLRRRNVGACTDVVTSGQQNRAALSLRPFVFHRRGHCLTVRVGNTSVEVSDSQHLELGALRGFCKNRHCAERCDEYGGGSASVQRTACFEHVQSLSF